MHLQKELRLDTLTSNKLKTSFPYSDCVGEYFTHSESHGHEGAQVPWGFSCIGDLSKPLSCFIRQVFKNQTLTI